MGSLFERSPNVHADLSHLGHLSKVPELCKGSLAALPGPGIGKMGIPPWPLALNWSDRWKPKLCKRS